MFYFIYTLYYIGIKVCITCTLTYYTYINTHVDVVNVIAPIKAFTFKTVICGLSLGQFSIRLVDLAHSGTWPVLGLTFFMVVIWISSPNSTKFLPA